MTRDEVIKGLECCTTQGFGCIDNKKCPYGVQRYGSHCVDSMLRDALALLKAQEPVEPIPTTDDDWTCGHCGMSLIGYEELDAGGFTTVRHNFCPNCGRAVKWDD